MARLRRVRAVIPIYGSLPNCAHASTVPSAGDEPAITGTRHPVLRGFDETDLLAFGGSLSTMKVDAGALVPLTFVPPFPTYPPETVLDAASQRPTFPASCCPQRGQSRIAYMPADIDRRYASEHLPDHARLLANIVRWAAGDTIPLAVEGTGLIDCHLYEQPGRVDPSRREPDERGDLACAGRRAHSSRDRSGSRCHYRQAWQNLVPACW